MTEASVPGVEEIGKIIRHAMASLNAPAHVIDRITSHDAAQRILDLFAPILAEKAERDAYEAKLVETGKWLQELAEKPPKPNEALKKLFADYKAAGVMSVGLDDDWKARALAAEAALAGERSENESLALGLGDLMNAASHFKSTLSEIDRECLQSAVDRSFEILRSHVERTEPRELRDELARLEAAAPLSARETARYLEIERKLAALNAAAIRAGE